MAFQKAVVMQGSKRISVVTDRPLPRLRPGYIGVKVKCVALNPTDWKHADFLNHPGSLLGCDYSGVVESVGDGCTKKWQIGDRICGLAHGGNRLEIEDGTFAQHIMVRGDCQMRIPSGMSFEDAATLGVGVFTCGQGLFQSLKLDPPSSPSRMGEMILIYGGSTATGTLGIQFAKLAGYSPIITCAPRNFELVKSLGAAAAFDYRDPASIDKIKGLTNGQLKWCWDTISLSSSAKLAAECLHSGGHYSSLLPVKWSRKDVEAKDTLVYTAFGETISKGRHPTPARPEDFQFAMQWADVAEKLLAEGKLRPHPTRVMAGGLDKIPEALDLLRKNKVSGEKLVFRVDEIPAKI